MPAQTVIKLRRDSAADWASVNPVLADGEAGLETDSGLVKYGNGTAAWADLPYATASSVKTKVQNATGSSIPKGSVVYISGANGDNPLITLADADSEATSSKTIGITETAIANGAQGYVIESGLLTGLNTGAATAGQSVWLSSTAGGFVFGAAPAKPAHSVYLGVVTRANTSTGTILVKVQNGYELNELHDVNAGSPTAGQVLQWDGDAWVNATLDALPAQTGNDGKYLTTDGTDASWAALDIPPGTQVSESAPSSPEEGQMWWNSATGTLYIYYDATWVEAVTGVVGPAGADGADGEPGVVAATAPITYDAGTQTVGINQAGITVAQSQVTGLGTALDGKANTSHTHGISDVTGLAAQLNGRILQITGTNIDAVYTNAAAANFNTIATVPVTPTTVGSKLIFMVDCRLFMQLGSDSTYGVGPQESLQIDMYLQAPGGSTIMFSAPALRDYLRFNGSFYATDGSYKVPQYKRSVASNFFKMPSSLITSTSTNTANYTLSGMAQSGVDGTAVSYVGRVWVIEVLI